MTETYADQVFLTWRGQVIELASYRAPTSFGERTAVQTMNPTGRPLGVVEGVGEGGLSIEVPVRPNLPDWDSFEDETLLVTQRRRGLGLDFIAMGAHFKSKTHSAGPDGRQMWQVEFGLRDWRAAG